ncbi:hypothetical protein NKG94_10790 [Micromonospora sp. M12]
MYASDARGIFLFVVDHTWSLLNTVVGAIYLTVHLIFGHSLDRPTSLNSGRVSVVEGSHPATPRPSAPSARVPARASSGTRTCTSSRVACSGRSTSRWCWRTTSCSPSLRCGCSTTTTPTHRSTASPGTSRSVSTRTCGTRPSRTGSRGRRPDEPRRARTDRDGNHRSGRLADQRGGEPVPIGPPRACDDGDGLTLWPLELRPARQTCSSGAVREPYRFTVRYLLCVTGPAGLPRLDRVLTTATSTGTYPVALEAGDPPLWTAIGTTPRPALLIDVSAQVDHPTPAAPPVLQPLRLRQLDVRSLTGRVVGPRTNPWPRCGSSFPAPGSPPAPTPRAGS